MVADPLTQRNICNPKGQHTLSLPVKEWNSRMTTLADNSSRRFVRVAPPTVHAGVGEALRQAFRLDGEMRSLEPFRDLLARLD